MNIYFDGGTKYSGVICVYDEVTNHYIVDAVHGLVRTNNELEYESLIRAIKYAQSTLYDKVTFIGDSQLIINQMQGHYKINKPQLRILHANAINELSKLSMPYNFKWVKRKFNYAGIYLENAVE